MKILIASVLALIGGVFLITTAQAKQDEQIITDEKVATIRERCVENLAALRRLHQTDAVLRTDRGELYRTISDKLMVPLNKRLVSNRLDGGSLVDLSATFSDQYDVFFTAYFEYDNALSDVLKINCKSEPVTFYNALLQARKKRDVLNQSNQKLLETIRKFDTSFADFKAKFEKENP